MGKQQVDWSKHIGGWRLSKLSQREYCKRHGLSYRSFSYWFRREAGNLNDGDNSVMKIIPIKVPLEGRKTEVIVELKIRRDLTVQAEFHLSALEVLGILRNVR